MASVTLNLDPADAWSVSMQLFDAQGNVVDEVDGATTAYAETVNLAPGTYTAVETYATYDGTTMRTQRETITVAPPKPRCEVKNWFADVPTPPPPPRLSHRCEVKDWF